MSSNALKYHLLVIWAILAVSNVSTVGLILDSDGLKAIFSDINGGIHSETPKGPISNETESFQGSPKPDQNTAPPRERDPSPGRGYGAGERFLYARTNW